MLEMTLKVNGIMLTKVIVQKKPENKFGFFIVETKEGHYHSHYEEHEFVNCPDEITAFHIFGQQYKPVYKPHNIPA